MPDGANVLMANGMLHHMFFNASPSDNSGGDDPEANATRQETEALIGNVLQDMESRIKHTMDRSFTIRDIRNSVISTMLFEARVCNKPVVVDVDAGGQHYMADISNCKMMWGVLCINDGDTLIAIPEHAITACRLLFDCDISQHD